MASEFDWAWKVLGPGEFNTVASRCTLEVGDEIVPWARYFTEQGCAKQSAVGLLDRDPKCGRLASKLSHNRRLEVAYEELGHKKWVISMIALVNQSSPASRKL